MSSAKKHIGRTLKEAARSSIYREQSLFLGTVSATNTIPLLHSDRGNLRVHKLILMASAAVAADDNDYWSVQATNKGSAGAGTADLFAAAPTTKAASEGAIAALVAYELTPDQNQEVAQGDTLAVVLTKANNAPDLEDLVLVVSYRDDL